MDFGENEACEKVFSLKTYRCAVWSESWSEIWCFNYRENSFNTNCTLWTCIQIKHSPLTFTSPIITFIFLRFQFSFSSVSRSLVVESWSWIRLPDFPIAFLSSYSTSIFSLFLLLLLKFVGFTMNMKFLSSETSLHQLDGGGFTFTEYRLQVKFKLQNADILSNYLSTMSLCLCTVLYSTLSLSKRLMIKSRLWSDLSFQPQVYVTFFSTQYTTPNQRYHIKINFLHLLPFTRISFLILNCSMYFKCMLWILENFSLKENYKFLKIMMTFTFTF
jgi:hypothetical protein